MHDFKLTSTVDYHILFKYLEWFRIRLNSHRYKHIAHKWRTHLMLNTFKRYKHKEEFYYIKRQKDESVEVNLLKLHIITLKWELL